MTAPWTRLKYQGSGGSTNITLEERKDFEYGEGGTGSTELCEYFQNYDSVQSEL